MLLLCLSCKEFAVKHTDDIVQQKSNVFDYQQIKKNIKNLGAKEKSEVSKVLFVYAKDSIFHAWMGTPWDFNGTSEVPQEGQIACGYFVTTIIRDLGFKIERVKLAQQVSSAIINMYCIGIRHFVDMEKMIAECSKQSNSVFIVGLDFHTGFLLNDHGKLYFIHASYGNPQCVVKEIAAESAVLASSKTFMTGDFLNETIVSQYWNK